PAPGSPTSPRRRPGASRASCSRPILRCTRTTARWWPGRSPRGRWGTCRRSSTARPELADSLAARGSFDAVPDLAEIFPTQVFPDAFGLQRGGRDQLLAYGALVFNGMGPRN